MELTTPELSKLVSKRGLIVAYKDTVVVNNVTLDIKANSLFDIVEHINNRIATDYLILTRIDQTEAGVCVSYVVGKSVSLLRLANLPDIAGDMYDSIKQLKQAHYEQLKGLTWN